MEYHEYECIYGYDGGATWYSKEGYNYKWVEWKTSTDDVQELAKAYYWEYERSGAMGAGNRPERAQKWYDYFTENPYPHRLAVPIWLLFKFKKGVIP